MTYVYYNITNLTSAGNQTNILNFVSGVNNILGKFPALLILLAIGIVIFFALSGRGVNPFKSFTATSWAMLILSVIMYPMQLINGKILILFAFLCPLSLFLLWVFGGESYG